MSKVKNLIFSPHVDDELLGNFSFLNNDTHVIETGVDEFHVVSREERLGSEKLAEHCGFSYMCLNTVNRYDLKDLIDQYEEAVNKYKPETALIPYPSYNQDHRAVYDLPGCIETSIKITSSKKF